MEPLSKYLICADFTYMTKFRIKIRIAAKKISAVGISHKRTQVIIKRSSHPPAITYLYCIFFWQIKSEMCTWEKDSDNLLGLLRWFFPKRFLHLSILHEALPGKRFFYFCLPVFHKRMNIFIINKNIIKTGQGNKFALRHFFQSLHNH